MSGRLLSGVETLLSGDTFEWSGDRRAFLSGTNLSGVEATILSGELLSGVVTLLSGTTDF